MSNRIVQQVKKTYSAIAEEFDATRSAPWPEFTFFLRYLSEKMKMAVCRSERLPEESQKIMRPKARLRASENKYHFRLLDVGCGNGRLFHFLKNHRIKYIGIDNNRTMLSFAKKKAPRVKFLLAEMTRLPFPDHSFDVVCCIAALHHLPTQKLQLQALKEIKRVCRKNGFCMITVWNLWQPKYKKFIQHATPRRGAIKKRGHHAWIPWGNKKNIQRFYYAFTKNELTDLIKKAGFTQIQNIKSKHNFATIAKAYA